MAGIHGSVTPADQRLPWLHVKRASYVCPSRLNALPEFIGHDAQVGALQHVPLIAGDVPQDALSGARLAIDRLFAPNQEATVFLVPQHRASGAGPPPAPPWAPNTLTIQSADEALDPDPARVP